MKITSWSEGGYKKDGENYSSFDYLKENLSDKFKLVKTIDIPLVFRQNDRSFKYEVSQMSIWEKRAKKLSD